MHSNHSIASPLRWCHHGLWRRRDLARRREVVVVGAGAPLSLRRALSARVYNLDNDGAEPPPVALSFMTTIRSIHVDGASGGGGERRLLEVRWNEWNAYLIMHCNVL